MRVLLATYGLCGDLELAVRFDTVAAVAEGCDALVAGGMMLAGGWR